jgi:hypothetical protein
MSTILDILDYQCLQSRIFGLNHDIDSNLGKQNMLFMIYIQIFRFITMTLILIQDKTECLF